MGLYHVCSPNIHYVYTCHIYMGILFSSSLQFCIHESALITQSSLSSLLWMVGKLGIRERRVLDDLGLTAIKGIRIKLQIRQENKLDIPTGGIQSAYSPVHIARLPSFDICMTFNFSWVLPPPRGILTMSWWVKEVVLNMIKLPDALEVLRGFVRDRGMDILKRVSNASSSRNFMSLWTSSTELFQHHCRPSHCVVDQNQHHQQYFWYLLI